MRCIIAIDRAGRYQYYVSPNTFSYDYRDAFVFPDSQQAQIVASSLGGTIIPV
jgi:hypothetical protein